MLIGGLLTILQALSALATIWGVMHTSATIDTAVLYGTGGDNGVSTLEWMNSFGSAAAGLVTFCITTYMQNKQVSELVLAGIAWSKNKSDTSALRRLGFAICDWLELYVVPRVADAAMRTWLQQAIVTSRQELAKIIIAVAQAPVQQSPAMQMIQTQPMNPPAAPPAA